ncbi:hypothetical protein BaRGS_00010415 [Batillaria attramentaria]|uniref:Uncharacterized protein n=1 Tax=Batillaria attramentaria TaxID=370345 RepID=A0ABD0LG36_9CAEN
MRTTTALVLLALWTLIDVIATSYVVTSLQRKVFPWERFLLFSQGFTLTTSDLLLLGVARACVSILWGVVTAGCVCRTSAKRVAVRYALLVMLAVMWMYNGGKLLALAEHPKVLADGWIIAALAWTCAACITTFIFIFVTKADRVSPNAATDKERQPLLSPTSVTPEKHHYKQKGLVIDKSDDVFHTAIVRLALVAAASTVCTWVRIWLFSMYVARFTARIRRTFFASVMAKDLDFFDGIETGDLVSRLMADTAVLGDSLSPNLDQFLRGFVTAVGVMGFIVMTSWRMSVLTVIFLPTFVVVAVFYGIVMKGIGVSGQSIMAVLGEMAEENFSNIRTVRSFATEEDEVQRFKGQVDNLYYYGKAEAWTHSSFQSLAWLFRVTLRLVVLFYGGHLVRIQVLSGGDLVTIVLYLEQINLSIVTINAVYGGMMKGVGASQVVFEYMDRKPRHGGQGSVVKDNFRGEIEFRDVTFAYPSRPHQTVLNKMSFRVSSGEVVALVGPSGGGKSTCVSLLQNFYRPSSGHVMLDGIPVHHYTHKTLHSKEPVLFSRSLRDNIAYGLDACSGVDVTSAAKQANAHDFICAMRDGYSTCAGEKGLQLSGGQKQRVAIARALVRDPAVLILDEATSALDSQSEAKVQEALSNSRQGRTVLVIAHRLSTVEAADRVLVVDKGRVAEDGPPSYLLALGGLYSALVRKQLIATGSQAVVSRGPVPVSDAWERHDADDEEKGESYGCSVDSGIAQEHYESFGMVEGCGEASSLDCEGIVRSLPRYGSVVPVQDLYC